VLCEVSLNVLSPMSFGAAVQKHDNTDYRKSRIMTILMLISGRRKQVENLPLILMNRSHLSTHHLSTHHQGWTVQQKVFVRGTCGFVHGESFNRDMQTLRVLESKWDPMSKKLVRRLLEERDKVLRSYFAQRGGSRSQGGGGTQQARVGDMSGTCMCAEGVR
jgi:hypothetical protein